MSSWHWLAKLTEIEECGACLAIGSGDFDRDFVIGDVFGVVFEPDGLAVEDGRRIFGGGGVNGLIVDRSGGDYFAVLLYVELEFLPEVFGAQIIGVAWV